MEELFKQLTLPQILSILGVPTIGAVFRWTYKKLKATETKTDSVQKGLQALLRSQMINDFNRWIEKGYAPIYARDNFSNMYEQYHNLGANGVMGDIYDKFMALPTQKKEKLL